MFTTATTVLLATFSTFALIATAACAASVAIPAASHQSREGEAAPTDTAAISAKEPRRDGASAEPTTTVILVRHAEKNTEFLGEDPPLNADGERRALALEHALRDAGIYVTKYRRSHDSAVPLGRTLGESLRVVHETPELVKRLCADHAGDTVLVVGHSDSVPQVIEGLGGPKAKDLGPVGYDGMWIVTFGRHAPAHVMKLHYGERIPPPAPH